MSVHCVPCYVLAAPWMSRAVLIGLFRGVKFGPTSFDHSVATVLRCASAASNALAESTALRARFEPS